MNIPNFIVENEAQVRMNFFLGVLIIMGLWELNKPRRKATVSKLSRWINNLGLIFVISFYKYCFICHYYGFDYLFATCNGSCCSSALEDSLCSSC